MKKLILLASILIMSSSSYAGFTRCRGGGMTWEISGGSGPTILGSVLVTAKDRSGKYWRGRGDFNSTICFMELRANVNGKNLTKKITCSRYSSGGRGGSWLCKEWGQGKARFALGCGW